MTIRELIELRLSQSTPSLGSYFLARSSSGEEIVVCPQIFRHQGEFDAKIKLNPDFLEWVVISEDVSNEMALSQLGWHN